MRKLTEADMTSIIGMTIEGYHVEQVRVKRGSCTDSDHYGILLCRNDRDRYVTWQWHLDENEEVTTYWGHYFMENRDAAVRDFNTRE